MLPFSLTVFRSLIERGPGTFATQASQASDDGGKVALPPH